MSAINQSVSGDITVSSVGIAASINAEKLYLQTITIIIIIIIIMLILSN
jgi:hypothetical protein